MKRNFLFIFYFMCFLRVVHSFEDAHLRPCPQRSRISVAARNIQQINTFFLQSVLLFFIENIEKKKSLGISLQISVWSLKAVMTTLHVGGRMRLNEVWVGWTRHSTNRNQDDRSRRLVKAVRHQSLPARPEQFLFFFWRSTG